MVEEVRHMTDGNQSFGGEATVVYTDIEVQYCIPEALRMLLTNVSSIKEKNGRNINPIKIYYFLKNRQILNFFPGHFWPKIFIKQCQLISSALPAQHLHLSKAGCCQLLSLLGPKLL